MGENRSKVDNYERCGDRLGDGLSCWGRTLPSVLALVLSLLSLASCLYLNAKTGDLQGRVWAAEHGKDGGVSFQVPGFSVDQLNSIVQEKVDRLLSQRSYEHMAKIRVSREAPAECNCPAVKASPDQNTFATVWKQCFIPSYTATLSICGNLLFFDTLMILNQHYRTKVYGGSLFTVTIC
ncbi:hypothetical protein FKM82_000973 [Ascaphus truei]